MRTITKTLFTFEELSEEAKEKAIEKQRNCEYYLDYEWWDFVYEDFHQKIKDKGFDITKIYFSGFWSQGDGAMFEYDGLDSKLLDEAADTLDLPNWKKSILKNGYISGKGRQSGHYYHENSCSHNIYVETDNGMQQYYNIERLFDTFHIDIENYIEELYVNLCGELYSALEKEYEYLMSDECISEHLEANMYEFEKDGTRY